MVKELADVNDAAKRGIKDIPEFTGVARDDGMRARMINVASSHRAGGSPDPAKAGPGQGVGEGVR